MPKTFLQAEWRKLAMANYVVDSTLLEPYVPYKTELDLWSNRCYVSLVGFMFINTRLKGFKIPFHTNFEEVNLRFYVRYNDQGEWKRGVVFVKEIVPKPALTLVANIVYKENYETMPMVHSWSEEEKRLSIEYRWKKGNWNSFKVMTSLETFPITAGSEEEFITEHYWGYTKVGALKTSEYRVEHPRWEVYKTQDHIIDVDYKSIYGADFAFLSNQKPVSVFLAEGSEISVNTHNYIY